MRLAKNIIQKVAWSTAVQYIGKVVQIAIGIFIVKKVTNSLGPEAFGQYGQIAEYVMFFSVAANLGIFGNVVRKMADAPTDGQLFFNAMILRGGISTLFFIIGIGAALIFSPTPAFLAGMLFFMASLFFDHLTSICNGALQANYWMGRSTLAMTLARLSEMGFVILLAQSNATMPLFFLAPMGASIMALALTTFFVRQKLTITPKLNKRIIQSIFWTALPFGVINVLNNLYFRFLPSFFMGQTLSDEQFGFYTLSLNIAMTASLFSTFLMYSVLPVFKHSLTEGHELRARNMFKLAIVILSLGALAMILIGTLLAPWTILTVSDASFWQNEIAHLYPLLLILAGVSYFYDLVLITIFALEKETWLLKREILAVVLGGAIMTLALFNTNSAQQVTLIIGGAITAELFLVTLGIKKIHHWMHFPAK